MNIFCQNFVYEIFPSENGNIIYTDVVELDTAFKAIDLYAGAKNWALDAFKSLKDVIQENDKDLHLLIIKAFIPIDEIRKYWFTLKIQTKDGRYKYTLYNIFYEAKGTVLGQHVHVEHSIEEGIKEINLNMSSKQKDKTSKYYQEINDKFKTIIGSLELAMKKIKKDEW